MSVFWNVGRLQACHLSPCTSSQAIPTYVPPKSGEKDILVAPIVEKDNLVAPNLTNSFNSAILTTPQESRPATASNGNAGDLQVKSSMPKIFEEKKVLKCTNNSPLLYFY